MITKGFNFYRPGHEIKRRAEAEFLPQRRRGAEISAEEGEERSIAEITETLVSRSGGTAIRASLQAWRTPDQKTTEIGRPGGGAARAGGGMITKGFNFYRPGHEIKSRAEAEFLPQRRRGAEISAEKGEERSIAEITETLVSRSGGTAIRAVRFKHGVHLTRKPAERGLVAA